MFLKVLRTQTGALGTLRADVIYELGDDLVARHSKTIKAMRDRGFVEEVSDKEVAKIRKQSRAAFERLAKDESKASDGSDDEAKAKEEAEAKAKADADAEAKAKQEAEDKAKADAEEKATGKP